MLALWCATVVSSAALGPPAITASYPGPALAGAQTVVNGTDFDPGAVLTFTWDAGLPSGDLPATADGGGNLFFQPVSVPLTLARGPHDLTACPPAPGPCAPPLPVEIGPVVSTAAALPIGRSAPITITVAGLPGGLPSRVAVFRWNGTLDPGPAILIPDAPAFDIVTAVPSDAPAGSVFQVCQEEPLGSGLCRPGTSGDLAIAVLVPVPPVPPTSSAAPLPSAPLSSERVVAPVVPPTEPAPTPSATPTPTPTPSPVQLLRPSLEPPAVTAAPVVVKPQPEARPVAAVAVALFTPKALVHLEVAAFAILTMASGGGMLRGIAGLTMPGLAGGAAATAAVAAGGSGGSRGGSAAGAKMKTLKSTSGTGAVGDESRSWRWPGTARLDSASLALPVRAGPASPACPRADRQLLPAGHARVGVAAAARRRTGARRAGGAEHARSRTAAAVGLLTALAVLGVFDALAGFVAASVFVVGVAAAGGFNTAAGVRTMLGLGVIWFAAPLIAGAARPLRRRPARSIADRRQRLGDFVIASLIGFWAIQKMISALPGLAQQALPVAAEATTVASIVLGASVLRMVLEGAAGRWYPDRLAKVQPTSVPFSSVLQRIAAAFLRTGIFLFVAIAFIGNHWQLWATGVLILAPQILSVYEDKFANSEKLFRVLPRGILKTVVMLFVGTAFGEIVLRLVQHSAHAALNALVLLAAASLALSVLSVFGRDGPEPDEGWLRWLAGVAVLAVGVLTILGFVG